MKNKIILIEGADKVGKSTLAQQIMEYYKNNVYIHNAVTNDIYSLHKNTIDTAILASEQHTVVIDRLHLSEYIYGNLFRNGPSYDIVKFENEVLNNIPNLVKILCIVDKNIAIQKHFENVNSEMFSSNDKVWDDYNTIIDNLKLSGWKTYNWKLNNINLDTFEITNK